MNPAMDEAVAAFNASLQAALDTESAYQFLPEGTWLEGGCGLLACALKARLGGRLVTVGRKTEIGVVDHVVLQIELSGVLYYLDYDGLQSRSAMEDKVRREWWFDAVYWGDFQRDQLIESGVTISGDQSLALANELESTGVFRAWP